MKTAYSILPHRFADERTSRIIEGLRAVEFEVVDLSQMRGRGPIKYEPKNPLDLIVTWTRHHGPIDAACTAFEEAGGRVLVCEEAHIRHPYPGSEQHFCLSIHDHNGAGLNCPFHGSIRFSDWRTRGFHLKDLYTEPRRRILVRQQRGIGSPAVRCPDPNWHVRFAQDLARLMPSYQVEPLTHPKNLKKAGKAVPSPADTFHDVAALVTWNSHTAAEALAEGVPVFHACKHSFWSGAAVHATDPYHMAQAIRGEIERLESSEGHLNPQWRGQWNYRRLSTFERYAWCQYSHTELKSGFGMSWLVGR